MGSGRLEFLHVCCCRVAKDAGRILGVRQHIAVAEAEYTTSPACCQKRKVCMYSPRVVIIDDSSTACVIVRRLLEREWYAVETYQQPLSALSALWQHADTPPAALILDVQLPQLDGYALTQLILTKAPH